MHKWRAILVTARTCVQTNIAVFVFYYPLGVLKLVEVVGTVVYNFLSRLFVHFSRQFDPIVCHDKPDVHKCLQTCVWVWMPFLLLWMKVLRVSVTSHFVVISGDIFAFIHQLQRDKGLPNNHLCSRACPLIKLYLQRALILPQNMYNHVLCIVFQVSRNGRDSTGI